MKCLQAVWGWATLFYFYSFFSVIVQAQQIDEIRVLISFQELRDRGKSKAIPFFPIFLADGNVYTITDSVGNASLEINKHYYIQSYFYENLSFQLQEDSKKIIQLERREIELDEIQVSTFRRPEDHIKSLFQSLESKLKRETFLANFSGYFAVRQGDRFVDFIQADGLALMSESQKWKPYDFVQAGWTNGKSYHYLAPLKMRRSYHWDWTGSDTIPASDLSPTTPRDEQFFIQPFYSRELFYAFMNSCPVCRGASDLYEYVYGMEGDKEVIYFSTKKMEMTNPKSDLFLMGEGTIVLEDGGRGIQRMEVSFSSYNYVGFPKKRSGRKREMAGRLDVQFEVIDDKLVPKEIDLSAKFFGSKNLYRPRPFYPNKEISIIEKIRYEDISFIKAKEKLSSLEEALRFIGFETMVDYEPAYWEAKPGIDKNLFNKIKKDLGPKVSIFKQFDVNGGKRLIPLSSSGEANTQSTNSSYKKYLDRLLPELRSISLGLTSQN